MKRLPLLSGIFLIALLSLSVGLASGQVQDLPPGPTQQLRATYGIEDAPPEAEVIQIILDFEPGAFTPPHTHGGPGFVTVLEGEMTRRIDGVDETFRAGEGWIEPGVVHQAGNLTDTKATVLFVCLLPPGAQLTTLADMAAR
jgi:quercetin dioxygenase-like cupin family protein